jgi:hypothetical protein
MRPCCALWPTYKHHITPARFYATARQVGIEWYSPFDNVVDLQGTTDCSVTTNKMPSLQTSAHLFGASTYIVHPGMLDSALFHGICASLLVEREIKAPVLPVFLEKLTMSTALEVLEGTELCTYALAQDSGSCWSVQIELNERAVISVHGLRTAQLPGNISVARSRHLAHSPKWVTHYPSLIASEKLRHQVTLQLYKLGEIEAAFRLISAGKHMGKVILTVDPDEMVQVRKNSLLLVLSTRSLRVYMVDVINYIGTSRNPHPSKATARGQLHLGRWFWWPRCSSYPMAWCERCENYCHAVTIGRQASRSQGMYCRNAQSRRQSYSQDL